ncbi:MAG: flagella basal body P-ring formation protein FlgA [Edaphobacter sp.]
MFSSLQYVKTGVVCLLSFQSMLAAGSAQSICYSTPHLAVEALAKNPRSSATQRNSGYRVTEIQSDPVLGQRWAVIATCEHPDWPAFALPVSGSKQLRVPQKSERSAIAYTRTVPIVRAGETILLWKQEDLLRIEAAGVAEENGDVGKTIRVRLVHRGTDDQSVPQELAGIVRGPSNVEIQR